MTTITELNVDLFGETFPSVDEIKSLARFVHSSERSAIAFAEQADAEAAKGGKEKKLAVAAAYTILTRYTEALEQFAGAQDSAEKLIIEAYALRKLGRFDESAETLGKAAKAGADSLYVNLEKTAVWRDAGELDKAAKELEGCANFKDINAQYHYEMGRYNHAQGLYEEAVENYEKAIEIDPEHCKALFHLAFSLDLHGDTESAIDYYKQLCGSMPVYINALLNLAVLYEDDGQYSKASKCVDQVLKHHPNHLRAILFKKDIESSKTMVHDEDLEKSRTQRNKVLETPVTDFELSVRSRNCLKKMNIHTIGDLLRITETELLAYKNFGETSLTEIKQILDAKGLNLGVAAEDGESVFSLIDDEEEDIDDDTLNRPIDELGLSVRAQKCLEQLDLKVIGDLTDKTQTDLLQCKNFGSTSLDEITEALDEMGLSLRKVDELK